MTKVIFLKKDVTGLLPDNFIQDEFLVTVTGSNRLVIPEYGSFFEDDFELRDADTNTVIDPAKYYFADLYQEAAEASGKAVWNLAIIKDSAINVNLKVSYRAYGGPFSRNAKKLIEWIKEREQDFLHPASWDEVTDIPKKFTPQFHNHLLRDIFGGEYFQEGLRRIENSITIGNSKLVQSIIDEVIEKLESTRSTALQMSKAIIETNINNVLNTINKKYLGLDLVANLDIATREEMVKAADISVSYAMFPEDKYINKDRLKIFSELVKDSVVSSKDTNLGLPRAVIGEPSKANLIATVNGAVITLDSIATNKANNIPFDAVVYPKNYPTTDQFTIVRITNNMKDKSGVWLGFNTDKLDAYIGIMNGDECFRRMRWYKFYTDGNLNELAERVKEHIRDTKNPHELTKAHIELDAVENYPVVTEAQILAQESSKSYVTMDTLSYFMAAHILNLKANPNEDGEVDLTADLFDKANIIYTPCDKTPSPVCPPRDQFLKDYCVGTEKMGRWTDGACGFYDKVMEDNSDDCNFFAVPEQGKEISTFCEGYTLMAKIADGRGATFDALKEEQSEKCGWNPPDLATLISTRCDGYNTISKYADGKNGNYEVTTSVNDPKCGYKEPTEEGKILAEFCNGPNRVTRYADGKGSSFEVISGINDEKCGYVAPTPPPPPPPTASPTPPPPPGETPGPPPITITKGMVISSPTTLANIGDKEKLTISLINLVARTTYQVDVYSYASINKEAKQLLVSKNVATGSTGGAVFTHEYTVTEDIFNISGATSNLSQLTVSSYATCNWGESNTISKQVKRGSNVPPVTAAPPGPPPSTFSVYYALDPNNTKIEPTVIIPVTQQLIFTKVYDYNNYNVASMTYMDKFVEKRIKSVTKGHPPGVYVQHHLEIMDASGLIVLATGQIGRSVTDSNGSNWITHYYANTTPSLFAGLGDGMIYKVRIKCYRESDAVVSYSEMFKCTYVLQTRPDDGGGA